MCVCLVRKTTKLHRFRLKWKKCLFKCISSKWTSPTIVEFNLWLMHSLEVNSPDLPEKVREEQIPRAARGGHKLGGVFEIEIEGNETKKKPDNKLSRSLIRSWGSCEVENETRAKASHKLVPAHAETGNLPGRASLSMNGTALWTEVKLPPCSSSSSTTKLQETCKHGHWGSVSI